MDVSIFLARIFGIMFVVLYGGLLINTKYYRSLWQDLYNYPFTLLLSGFIALLCGLLVIQVHNVWAANWHGLITLLGWIMIVSGGCRIMFPETVLKIAQKLNEGNFIYISSVIMFILGLYLTYVSFAFE